METVEIRCTSSSTAEASPIVLRDTDQVRLVFLPTLVENRDSPRAAIKGAFVYQKKGKNDAWSSLNTESLSTIKKGEAFKLELHSSELARLGDGLRALYELKKEKGIPRGRQKLIKVEPGVAAFLELSDEDLLRVLDANPTSALKTLQKLIRWIGRSASAADVDGLNSLPESDFPEVSSLLGLANLKRAILEWKAASSSRHSEEFWQQFFVRHACVLSQVFAHPVVVIAEKVYVGGKQLDNKGGKVADFLARAAHTHGVVIIEIKTPETLLLGAPYRNAYPFSVALCGAIAQVLGYRQSLMANFTTLRAPEEDLVLGEPRCVVVCGSASAELTSDAVRNGFELLRERVAGVTVVTFDELIGRVSQTISVLEDVAE